MATAFVFGLFLLEVLGHFVLLAQLRFEKGARRVHRLDDVAVRGGAADEVQQVAPPVRCLVLPRPLGGAGELHGQGMLLPVPDSGHAPLAVPLDAVWQIAPADNFGVGLELGVERLAGLVEILSLRTVCSRFVVAFPTLLSQAVSAAWAGSGVSRSCCPLAINALASRRHWGYWSLKTGWAPPSPSCSQRRCSWARTAPAWRLSGALAAWCAWCAAMRCSRC